jgi:hypothetical protein
MTRVLTVSAVLVVVLVAAPATAQTNSLRWARGVVTESTPASITLMLRDRSLRIGVNPSTAFESATPAKMAAAGAVVEVHYAEKKNERMAVWVFSDPATGSAGWSKKPGHSYWGVMQGTAHGSFKLGVGKKTRKVELDSHTRLVDADGRVLAKGKKDVAPLLSTGQRVVVKYDEEDTTVYGGDTVVPGSSTKALEVRKLK